MLVCGDFFVLGRELPLHRSSNDIGLPGAVSLSSVRQAAAQFGGKPYSNPGSPSSLSDILPVLSDIRKDSSLVPGQSASTLSFFPGIADELDVTIAPEDRPSAVIRVPAEIPGEPKRSIPCVFQGLEGKRLLLQANEPIRLATTASVEFNDAMFLGEVIACDEAANDGWNLELKVEHVLSGLQSLMALRSQLLGEPMSPVAELASAFARVRN